MRDDEDGGYWQAGGGAQRPPGDFGREPDRYGDRYREAERRREPGPGPERAGRPDPSGYQDRYHEADRLRGHDLPSGREQARAAEPEVDAWRPRTRSVDGQPARTRAEADTAMPRTKPKASRGRRIAKWSALAMGLVVVATLSVGGYVYLHLNGNIQTASLLPPGQTQAPEIPDKFGRTPLNILVIGSDARSNAEDCHLAGACHGPDAAQGQRADVEMVVHLSADRSNATVMSIPRDTVTNLPPCAHDNYDLINGALMGGPGCQVQEVHNLTGLTIDDFIMVDMSGVVALSDALGGVQVCVTNNVYDSYSGLKLSKGTHDIEGVQALEWVRSRHAYTNEVDREEAQHLFLSAMIRKLKANASLSNVSTLYSVANIATKELTVSPKLDSVDSLLSLAQELGKVPTDRITMMSMPTVDYDGPDSAFREQLSVDQANAPAMFAALRADVPYTKNTAPAVGASGTPTAPASPTAPAVDTATVKVTVRNGTLIGGRAADVKAGLTGNGFTAGLVTTGNASGTAAATAVYYPAGKSAAAAAVAAALGIPASAEHQSASYSTVTVVVGADWAAGSAFPGSTAAKSVVAAGPPVSSLETNASNATCMQVPKPEW